MFRYVSDVSNLSHYIIKNFCKSFDCAIDATLGNGHDTDFLKDYFRKVYAFDIQRSAIENYMNRNTGNIELIHDSHENLAEYIKEEIDCIVFNLGFLPGGDKNITTKRDSTLKGINSSLNILKNGGIITIALYSGHAEGKEESEALLSWAATLSKNQYGVMHHTFINRSNNPPSLLVVEKK
jgi:SAM-dependent methyltransferase